MRLRSLRAASSVPPTSCSIRAGSKRISSSKVRWTAADRALGTSVGRTGDKASRSAMRSSLRPHYRLRISSSPPTWSVGFDAKALPLLMSRLIKPSGQLLLVTPFTWLEAFTPPSARPRHGGTPMSSADRIEDILGDDFVLGTFGCTTVSDFANMPASSNGPSRTAWPTPVLTQNGLGRSGGAEGPQVMCTDPSRLVCAIERISRATGPAVIILPHRIAEFQATHMLGTVTS